jgi:hypothetical protein
MVQSKAYQSASFPIPQSGGAKSHDTRYIQTLSSKNIEEK